MKDHNDWQLLQEYVRSRSHEAFAEVVRRHIGWVRASAARQVRDPHLADDVAQAVFVALAQQAPRLRERAALSTWLFQVTRYASSTALRAQSRRKHHERQAAMNTQVQDRSIEPQQWEKLSPILDRLIARLRADDQRAVLLRFFQQKTYPEMAVAMGISEEAARKRTERAVDRLRRMIGGRAMNPNLSAGALSAGLLTNGSAPASASLASAATELAIRGADPTTVVSTISKGALQMMTLARWRLPLAACAATVLVTAVAVIAPAGDSTTAVADPAVAVAATQPAAAVDETSPKEVILAAFRAAADGDADGLISRFDAVTPRQTQTLRDVVQLMAAAKRFTDAVEVRFGAEERMQLSRALGLGVVEMDVTDGVEKTDGDTATVDIGAGPGEIPLVRVANRWKISSRVLESLNASAVAQRAGLVPAIEQVTADIRAGKYQSMQELQQVMARMLPSRG